MRSKGEDVSKFHKILDDNEFVKEEESKVRKTLDSKYTISIDFALISAVVLT